MKFTRQLIWLFIGMMLAACGETTDEGNAPQSTDVATDAPLAVITPVEIIPGLSMRRLREGSGATAEPGHTAVVHYTGWLFDETAEFNRGAKFDSSVDRGVHFEFTLGAGRVIRGWDEGVAGMKIGEIRELTIAPELAYGDRQVGNLIPAGSTLIFEVELADLKGLDEQAATP